MPAKFIYTLDLTANQPAGASLPSQPARCCIDSINPALNAFHSRVEFNPKKLVVGKVSLAPQRGCPAGDPATAPARRLTFTEKLASASNLTRSAR